MTALVPTGVKVTYCPPAGVVLTAARVRALRAAVAATHPDRGGTPAAFRAALAALRAFARPRRAVSTRWGMGQQKRARRPVQAPQRAAPRVSAVTRRKPARLCCGRAHALTAGNTYLTPAGHRRCRQCRARFSSAGLRNWRRRLVERNEA